jgi:hypothetical protein
MDLRNQVQRFVEDAAEILKRLRTRELETLSRADLHVLEVQLHLLGKEVTASKSSKPPRKTDSLSHFPPFIPHDGTNTK